MTPPSTELVSCNDLNRCNWLAIQARARRILAQATLQGVIGECDRLVITTSGPKPAMALPAESNWVNGANAGSAPPKLFGE